MRALTRRRLAKSERTGHPGPFGLLHVRISSSSRT